MANGPSPRVKVIVLTTCAVLGGAILLSAINKPVAPANISSSASPGAPEAISAPEFVSDPVGRFARSEKPRFTKLCASITKEIKWPGNTPTYHSDLYGVMDGRLPVDVSYIAAQNGAHWENPRVENGKCLIDLSTSGIVRGNSYFWSATCEVRELSVTDEHNVAFTQFDPSSCR